MSEYGAGLTVNRIDSEAISEDEADMLAAHMNTAAQHGDRHGTFEEAPDCGLAWEEDDGGYTLVVTSSHAYHAATPEEIQDDATEHDLDYARWLAQALEQAFPKTYRFEADMFEW